MQCKRKELTISSALAWWHYGKQGICRVPRAHGKATNPHGKGFAVCCSRQRAHGNRLDGKRLCAVSRRKSARQTDAETNGGYTASGQPTAMHRSFAVSCSRQRPRFVVCCPRQTPGQGTRGRPPVWARALFAVSSPRQTSCLPCAGSRQRGRQGTRGRPASLGPLSALP